MAQKEEIYKNRQAIVEHPFGTIKRQWGFNHVMTKKYTVRASADIGLIMSAYNLRRLFNILSFKELRTFITKSGFKSWILAHKAAWSIRSKCKCIFKYLELIPRLNTINDFSYKLVVGF